MGFDGCFVNVATPPWTRGNDEFAPFHDDWMSHEIVHPRNFFDQHLKYPKIRNGGREVSSHQSGEMAMVIVAGNVHLIAVCEIRHSRGFEYSVPLRINDSDVNRKLIQIGPQVSSPIYRLKRADRCRSR